MAPHILPELTPEEASRTCMEECHGMCCRGPIVLLLEWDEVDRFLGSARDLGVSPVVVRDQYGSGWLRFTDHQGDRCPMLDPDTWACRIYDSRPQRCRDFPEKKTPGCAISGG